jgi:DNA-binding CsgD family transcriptional regulator
LDADNSWWCLTVRIGTPQLARPDLCSGWRVRHIVHARPSPELNERVRVFLEQTDKQNPVHMGETTINVLRASGEFRVHRLHGGLVDLESFERSEHYRLYYSGLELNDRMWVASPVNADVESGLVLDRQGRNGHGRFTAADAERAEFILRGMRWFHRRLALSHGVSAGQDPCTPAERRALSLLLTGKSEKEIADELKLSVGTTHNRIGAVFRKFGVRSRAELMALWL